MKTAENWVKEYNSDRHKRNRKLKHSNGDYVRAIQLDALRAAADLAHGGISFHSYDYDSARLDARKAILEAIETL